MPSFIPLLPQSQDGFTVSGSDYVSGDKMVPLSDLIMKNTVQQKDNGCNRGDNGDIPVFSFINNLTEERVENI